MKAIIIFGPPGSGKSTQAEILADKYNLVHFNTGKVIENYLFKKGKKDKESRKQKELFKKGKLCSSAWVVKIVKKEIEKIYRKKKGIVFSGSPRTIYEAKKIVPLLEKLYGKNNLYVFQLKVPKKICIFRNTHRKICQQCGLTLIYNQETEKLKNCPRCGGLLKERVLDTKKTMLVRLKTYEKETKPVLDYLSSRKIKIYPIDGTPLPYKITENISQKIENDKIKN